MQKLYKIQVTILKNICAVPDIKTNDHVTFILMVQKQMKNKSKRGLKYGGILYHEQ